MIMMSAAAAASYDEPSLVSHAEFATPQVRDEDGGIE
jgi:hypothetical protein